MRLNIFSLGSFACQYMMRGKLFSAFNFKAFGSFKGTEGLGVWFPTILRDLEKTLGFVVVKICQIGIGEVVIIIIIIIAAALCGHYPDCPKFPLFLLEIENVTFVCSARCRGCRHSGWA